MCLTHRVITDSDNGMLSVRHQAITLTNIALFSIGPSKAYFAEILSKF